MTDILSEYQIKLNELNVIMTKENEDNMKKKVEFFGYINGYNFDFYNNNNILDTNNIVNIDNIDNEKKLNDNIDNDKKLNDLIIKRQEYDDKTYKEITDVIELKSMTNIHYFGFWLYNNIEKCNEKWKEMPFDNYKKINMQNALTYPRIENKNIELLAKLKQIQKIANKKFSLGFSKCRVCNINNGHCEYSIDFFVWPEGYIHYLEEHNFEIPTEFSKFIMNFDFNIEHNITFLYDY